MEKTNAFHINLLNRLIQTLKRSFLLWGKPFAAALLTGLIFSGITSVAGIPWRLATTNFYNYLADAFLNGQLYLRVVPTNTLDLSLYQGHYYLYWGPLPAVILMPFVAGFGLDFSDRLQSIIIGSINTGIFALLLQRINQRGLIKLEPMHTALLVIFFALGTAQAPLLALGTVWHIAQLLAICFSLLAYLAAFSFENKKAFFWTGCALACVLATRTSAIFVSIFLIWYLLHRHWHQGLPRIIKYCLTGIAPVAGVMVLLFLYNAARFGNPLETGLSYHLMAPNFYEMYSKYGVLNIHYIPTNLYYNFIFYPFVTFWPFKVMAMGGSLFLLSPFYFAAIVALWQNRKDKTIWFLFLSILIGSIPSLMIMAPGSVNFGPRYLLDIAPPLLILTAYGMRRWHILFISVCVVVSVLHYLVGTLMMVYAWY